MAITNLDSIQGTVLQNAELRPKKRKSVAEATIDKQIEKVAQKNDEEQSLVDKVKNIFSRKDPEVIKEIDAMTDEQYDDLNTQAAEELSNVENIDIPDGIDVIETERIVSVASTYIPDQPEISELKFTPINAKNKRGYHKTKVAIKKEHIPQHLIDLASRIKKVSNGVIKPRVTDLRVIANTNRTQLRNSELKLTSVSVTFKPDSGRLKTNKGTRVITSVPENDNGEINMYLSESRNHSLNRIAKPSGWTDAEYFDMVADMVNEFFTHGYEIVHKKIMVRSKPNPLMSLIDTVINNGDYRAKPYLDSDDNAHINRVDFWHRSTKKNQWLFVVVVEVGPNAYLCNAFRRNDKNDDFAVELNVSGTDQPKDNYTIAELNKNLVRVMDLAYERDWSDVLGIKGDDKIEQKLRHHISELSFRQMKNAYTSMINYMFDEESKQEYDPQGQQLTFDVKEIVTKRDFEKQYGTVGESVIGVTKLRSSGKEICEFALTYQLLPLKKADKRDSQSYITSDRYYEMTGIKDRRQYKQRSRSIGAKEGANRNYHTGAYVFVLEYKVGNKEYKYIAKTFEEIAEDTRFLTDMVAPAPKSKYDQYL